MVNGKGPGEGRQGRSQTKKSAHATPAEQDAEANEGHAAKRSRVSRACDQCRASREKCDGDQPTCLTCSSQDRTCSYNEQPKKRGIQPNYIRTLELTLAWLFEAFPQSETALSAGLPRDDHHAHRVIGAKDLAASEALHLAWRTSLINKQIDQLLSGTTIDHGRGVARSPEYVETAPRLKQPHVPNLAYLQEIPETSRTFNGMVKLPENAWTLLEYYFAFTHSWLPMTEKSSILKLMYSYPIEGLSLVQMTAAEHAELWSIMALAATQVADELNRDEIERVSSVAKNLIPLGNASYEVPHIKAMLLLALIDVNQKQILSAWLRIGTVVSLLLLFKIIEKLGTIEKFCRHIHLAAFVVETAIASHLKAPCHLSASYIDDIGLVDEDGLDEWAPWQNPLIQYNLTVGVKGPARSFSTLNELVRISRLYSDGNRATFAGDADGRERSSVVFSLLTNASSLGARMQPSTLVHAYKDGLATANSNVQSSPNYVSAAPTGFDSSTTPAAIHRMNLSTPLSNGLAQLAGQHPFMSVPNEANDFAFDSVHTFSTDGQPGLLPNAVPEAEAGPDTGLESTADANIFEEFDAMLERHDSNNQQQFMQNLGFGPDLDLLEFFGEDYRPSQPFLEYLNPSPFRPGQSNDNVGSYTG